MNVTVIGTGYVGLVTGTCLAEVGNHVVCIDNDKEKVRRLDAGQIPIFEPGLEPLVRKNQTAGKLDFSDDIKKGIKHGEVLFIAVGTPPDEDGSADLKHILDVAASIGHHIDSYKVVVTKSTVPVGTADKVLKEVKLGLAARNKEVAFSVVSNPEFLKEGAAVEDFMKPDRIVIGVEDDDAVQYLRTLYAPFNRNHDRLIVMDIRSAELTKYAANAMLATKISFMNEMANLAEKLDADIELVRKGIGADPRIGYHFIYPGCGYGGSCFPKDVKALEQTAIQNGYQAKLLNAVEDVNTQQKYRPFEKIIAHFGENLAGLKFAIWGLAFKPNTDDMREAPSRIIIDELLNRGANVIAFDPVAMEEAESIYKNRESFSLGVDAYSTLIAVDGLIVVTEWNLFRSPDFSKMKELMTGNVIVDGRNIFDPEEITSHGFKYYGIGRRLH